MSFFNKILNLGLDATSDPEEANRIRALNLYVLLGAQFFVLPVGLITLIWFPIPGIAMLVGYPFYTLVHFFTYLHRFSVARSLVLYTNIVHCWILMFVLTSNSMAHLWFLVFAALAFLLYPRSSKVNLFIVVVIGVLSFNFWCFWDPHINALEMNLASKDKVWLRVAFAPAASIILPLLLAFFYEGQYRAEQKIRMLKEQQDGDYFLTNLIMRPLFKNFNKSIGVKSEFLIQQKKTFVFRKWKGDLGGDLCVTGNLLFYGRKHTLFVSADAMGKSMQGAGGAIVFGTVMNNIISRSASNHRNITIDPAVWLEQTFHELHASFVPFEGSMLNSCVLGLIDDSSGKMIYFNSEHPSIVLLRDGNAEFLDHSIMQKLGSPLMERFKLSRFQLLTDDILLVGSDGRDDIILNDSGEMNDDESLFLRFVEKANGDLTGILDQILNLGAITDDFSLIRIDFLGSESMEHLEFPNENQIRKMLRERKIKEVTEIFDGLPHEDLSDGLIFLKCFALDRVGRGTRAKSMLETLLDRNPEHFETLILLGSMARRSGEDKEADELLNKAKKINPSDPRLRGK